MNKQNNRFKKGAKVDVEKMPLKKAKDEETRKEIDDKTSLFT